MTMVDVQSEIDRITGNLLTDGELVERLDSELLLVRANAILGIARRQLSSSVVIDKLGQLARQQGGGRIFGTLTCARLAAAALHWIGTAESKRAYDSVLIKIDEQEREDLEHVIRDGPDALR